MELWKPPAGAGQVTERERLEALIALTGVESAMRMAREHEQPWAQQGQAVWAMRLLQVLQGTEEEIRGLRAELCAQARDGGVPLRDIASAAGTTHATARKWANDALAGEAPVSQNPFEDHSSRPIWTLGADAIREAGRSAGMASEAIETQLKVWAAGQGWKAPELE